jgi:hypothetical protein
VSLFSVRQYISDDYEVWNQFVSEAKNATFLFHRDFMEYHRDRFEDFSLLVFNNKEKLVAVLPANRVEECLFSHQGLTYGGLLFELGTKTDQIFSYFDALLEFLKINKIKKVYIKPIPLFYNHNYASEIEFYLFQKKAVLLKKELNLTSILCDSKTNVSKSKLKKFQNKQVGNLIIKEERNFASFWNTILIPRLHSKYDSKPVHSLEEIQSLSDRFPKNIRQFNAYFENEIIAGVTIFEEDLVVKSQYGAGNALGEEKRALDFLFINLIQQFTLQGKQFFDMGTVTNDEFKNGYNIGLLQQKEEFGCVLFEQNYYELTLE